jgi:hypothetical protein
MWRSMVPSLVFLGLLILVAILWSPDTASR